jgi:hypothetical protein
MVQPPVLVLAALALMLAAVGPLHTQHDAGFDLMRAAPPDAQDAQTLADIEAAPGCEATPAMRERTDGSNVEGLRVTCPGPSP